MACKTGCVCKCGTTGCSCFNGLELALKKDEQRVKPNENLMLSNLPKWNCCSHCRLTYCPNLQGHYVPCAEKTCEHGNTQMGVSK